MTKLSTTHFMDAMPSVTVPGRYDSEQQLRVGDNLLQADSLYTVEPTTIAVTMPTGRLVFSMTLLSEVNFETESDREKDITSDEDRSTSTWKFPCV